MTPIRGTCSRVPSCFDLFFFYSPVASSMKRSAESVRLFRVMRKTTAHSSVSLMSLFSPLGPDRNATQRRCKASNTSGWADGQTGTVQPVEIAH